MHYSVRIFGRSLLLFFFSLCALSAQDIEEVARAPVFTLGGGISANTSLYTSSGIEERQSPFSWTISGSLTPTVKTFSFPLTFVLSERERSFHQPFNIVGLSPSYRWATLHLGYRTMSFSRYTLAGKQFFGAGLDLKPGPFRFSAMYGRFQRAVERDTTQEYNLPAYAQFGHALQIGYDGGAAKALLSWVRAKDDTASLKQQVEIPEYTPQENNVFGIELGFTIVPQHLTFEAEGGISLYTRDLFSPDIDLEEADIPTFFDDIQNLTLSTTLTIAGKAGMNLTFPKWGVRLGYERIEPEFRSLGAYYFNTDIENWTIAPNARLGNVRFSGSLGLQSDNLLGQKLAQTDRVIGSISGDWQPSQTFGLNLSYSNYSTGQVAGRRVLNDTIAVRNVTQSASISPRLFFQGSGKNQSISLVASYQDFTDLNAFTQQLTDNSSLTGSLGYNISFLESKLSLGAGLTASKTDFATGGSELIGVNMNAGTTLLKDDILSVNGSLGVSRVSTTGLADFTSTVLNESLGIGYRLTDVDNINLTGYSTQSSAGGLSASGVSEGFSEVSVQVGYSRSFNIIE